MLLKTPILLLAFFCVTVTGYSQPGKDSLKAVMRSAADYKERIKAYISYSENFNLKDFDELVQIASEGIELAKRNNDPVSAAELTAYEGTAYYFKGKYDIAAKHFYAAIAELEPKNEFKKLAYVYNDLAKLYRKTRDLERALINYDKALSIFEKLKDSIDIAMINNESGVVFEYKKDYEEAIRRYRISLQIDSARGDEIGVSYALSNLGGVYLIQNRYEEAESFMEQSLAIRRTLNDNFMLGLAHSDMASVYLTEKKFAKADAHFDTSNKLAKRMGYPELLATNYKQMSELERQRGNYKKAFGYLEAERQLHDSLFNKDKIQQIEELNTKYETVKKENIIEQQKYQIAKRNYWIIGGIAVIAVIIILSLSIYKRNQLKQEAKLQHTILAQQELATRAVLETEENERQRIAKDLHDGVGQTMSAAKMNLSALKSNLTFVNEKQQTSYNNIIKLVDESCSEIRSVSHNMMPNALMTQNLEVAFGRFINQISDTKLKVDLYTQGLDKRLDSIVETVLYRVIQECVNNVIKHADASSLDISIIKDEDGISATIEDNGKGFTAAKNVEGMGLKNIRTRIEFLKGEVEFTSTPGEGTLVSIHIPV
jgi:two-component system, NarL family, sensor kinase